MSQSALDSYLETRVLSADPLELVRLLYQAAISAVQDARHHLAAGKIMERSRSISRACAILAELHGALDHYRGGEIAGRLAALYDYMHRKLLEANLHQSDPPLGEVLGLLATLSEGWAGAVPVAQPPVPAHNPWAEPVTPETTAPYSPGVWSL